MLALLATVAGSMITGYSAYKILTTQKGQGRKLRDMEVLRRLNIPPKKQARIWTFLMALGIVLLTPGLGLLLSSDPISGASGYKSPSNLRANPSSDSPVMVPPSEKLDKTPRIVEKGESGSSKSPFFFASSGSSRSSYSGGGGTSSEPSMDETVAEIDEQSQKISEIDEGPEILESRPAQSRPKIEREPEKTEKARAAESLEPTGDKGPAPTTDVVIRAPPAERSVPEEESRVQDRSDYPEAESTSTKPQTAAAVVDVGPEKKTAPVISRPVAASIDPEPISKTTQAQPVVMEVDDEEDRSLDGAGLPVIGDVYQSPSTINSTDPFEFEVEVDLAEPSPSTEASDEDDGVDLTGPDNASDDPPIGEPVTAAVPPAETKTDGVKRLVFKDDPSREIRATANDSGEESEPPNGSLSNESLSNLTKTSGEINTGPNFDGFSGGLEFGKEFNNFTMQFQPGMGTDRGGASKPVSIIEFEKIDLGSNFGGGFGLTPTSPI